MSTEEQENQRRTRNYARGRCGWAVAFTLPNSWYPPRGYITLATDAAMMRDGATLHWPRRRRADPDDGPKLAGGLRSWTLATIVGMAAVEGRGWLWARTWNGASTRAAT